ncbi:hypothetical protein [Bifidobacterium sp. SO1]|uniref:hypothetical protein n=1 Tax=Bifidobacterium sp. SO1 TaxID=2809029 RepID=UPI001BDC3D82|nr:hypothetical protein [Bifidobacterium sp. SO1]MBT1161737.1 hypothetical protein [Bifidobacterium sp. SO1]
MGKHVSFEEHRRRRAWDQWLRRLLDDGRTESVEERIPEAETTLDMVLGELTVA